MGCGRRAEGRGGDRGRGRLRGRGRRRRRSACPRRRWASGSPWIAVAAGRRRARGRRRRRGRRVLRERGAADHRGVQRRHSSGRGEDLLGRQAHRGFFTRAWAACGEAATPLNFGIARPALEHARPSCGPLAASSKSQLHTGETRRLPRAAVPPSGRCPRRHSRLAERGGALLEGAAERSRTSMRTRFERLRLAWRSLVQTAAAATVAYLIATEVVGHAQPFFAPIAAIITLGVTVGQRGRRAVELALGVAVGIAVADALVLLTGPGRGALAIVVPLAMGTAVFLGSGQIFATQAAVSAVLVAVLQPRERRLLGRALRRRADRRRRRAARQLAAAARRPGEDRQARRRAGARGARARRCERSPTRSRPREEEAAERALLRARDLDELEADLQEAVAVSRETARFAPARRRDARHGRLLRRRGGPDRPRDPQRPRARPRGAARRAAGGEPPAGGRRRDPRPRRGGAERCATRSTDPERADAVREPALHAAAHATRVLEETGNLSVTVVVGQVRSTAVDLLRGSGLTYEEASSLVREAARAAEVAGDAADVSCDAAPRPAPRTRRRCPRRSRSASTATARFAAARLAAARRPRRRPSSRACARASREPSTWAMIAEDGGLVAGHAGYVPQPGAPGSAHLWQLFVRPPWWGTGVAAALLDGGGRRGGRRGLPADALLHPARPGARPRASTSARASATPAGRRSRSRSAWCSSSTRASRLTGGCGGERHWSASRRRSRCCAARRPPPPTGAATRRPTSWPSTSTGAAHYRARRGASPDRRSALGRILAARGRAAEVAPLHPQRPASA